MIDNIKIFIPLGTQKFQFDRLVDIFNQFIKKGLYRPNEILMQSSIYQFQPLFLHKELIPVEEFNLYLKETPIIITHSGVNSIISCMNYQKPFIIVPRLKDYGEHVDNHQVEIADLMEQKFNCLVVKDMRNLLSAIQKAPNHQYLPWKSNNLNLIESIRRII